MQQLEHRHAANALQIALAVQVQRQPVDARIAHQRRRRLGEEDLSTVTCIAHTFRAVHVVADVVVVADHGLIGVEPLAHTELRTGSKRALSVNRCRNRVSRVRKRDEERGAFGSDLDAVVCCERVA